MERMRWGADDFLAEEGASVLRYFVIDLHNGLLSRKVIVAPTWVSWVDWGSTQIRIKLSTEPVKSILEYDSLVPIDRRYEARLHEQQGRSKYWEGDLVRKNWRRSYRGALDHVSPFICRRTGNEWRD